MIDSNHFVASLEIFNSPYRQYSGYHKILLQLLSTKAIRLISLPAAFRPWLYHTIFYRRFYEYTFVQSDEQNQHAYQVSSGTEILMTMSKIWMDAMVFVGDQDVLGDFDSVCVSSEQDVGVIGFGGW